MMLLPALLFVAASAGAATDLVEIDKPPAIAAAFQKNSRLRIVNLWATWCAPCVAEMPELDAIQDRFASAGVELLGVSLDDVIPGERKATKNKVQRFLAKKEIGFRNFYFTGKANDLAEHFDFEGEIPITLVFDARGKELFRHQGVIEKDEFVAEIRKLLRKKP